MKTIHKIQNVIAVIALTMAIHIATSEEMTTNETISATIMVVLSVVMLLERHSNQNKEEEYDRN